MTRLTMLLLLTIGCASKESGTDDGSAADVPDITGKYQIFPGAATGCTDGVGEDAVSENFWVVDWATGLLKISDESGDLSFIFPAGGDEGYTFTGSILSNATFTLYGEAMFEGSTDRGLGEVAVMARLSVDGSGTAEMNGNCWKLKGDMLVNVDEDDNGLEADDCQIEVPFEASQLSGGTCTGAR
jgi:hypothetical protein